MLEPCELLSGEHHDDLWADTVAGGSCSSLQGSLTELFERIRTTLFGGAVLIGGVGSAEGLQRDAGLLCRAPVQQPGEREPAIRGVGCPHPARAVLFSGTARQRFGSARGQ